ncbi:MAG: arsenate reductase ArsC [Candidatus Krumholzibacteriia bacterium]
MSNGKQHEPRTVLFLCTGNSCRSQIAEAWARELLGDRVQAYSAGVEAHGLHPKAVRVMAEVGVDIARQRSQHVDEFRDLRPDLVVTVCDHAAEICPAFPGAPRMLHRSFRDPARATGSEDEILEVFRQVRDQIRDFVRDLPALLEDSPAAPGGEPGDAERPG